MKHLMSVSQLAKIKGGGCYKYLRRMNRARRREEWGEVEENLELYLDCMGYGE